MSSDVPVAQPGGDLRHGPHQDDEAYRKTITHALTVPANFNDSQRQATKVGTAFSDMLLFFCFVLFCINAVWLAACECFDGRLIPHVSGSVKPV